MLVNRQSERWGSAVKEKGGYPEKERRVGEVINGRGDTVKRHRPPSNSGQGPGNQRVEAEGWYGAVIL